MSFQVGKITSTSNNIILNNNVSSSSNTGILLKRWQTDNDSGLGDIVNGTSDATGTFASATTFPVSFTTGGTPSAVNDYYIGWWLRITNDTPVGILDEVRQITAYTGSTRTFVVSSAWSAGSPTASTTFALYSSNYISFVWDETNDRLVCTGLPRDTDTTYTNTSIASLQTGTVYASSVQPPSGSNGVPVYGLPYFMATNASASTTISASQLQGGVITLTNATAYTFTTTANLATAFNITSATFTVSSTRPTFRVLAKLSGGQSQSATLSLGTGQQWTNKTASSTVTVTGGAELLFEFTSTSAMTITVLT